MSFSWNYQPIVTTVSHCWPMYGSSGSIFARQPCGTEWQSITFNRPIIQITCKSNPWVYNSLLVLLDAVHLYRIYWLLDTPPLYLYQTLATMSCSDYMFDHYVTHYRPLKAFQKLQAKCVQICKYLTTFRLLFYIPTCEISLWVLT